MYSVMHMNNYIIRHLTYFKSDIEGAWNAFYSIILFVTPPTTAKHVVIPEVIDRLTRDDSDDTDLNR